MNLSSHHITPGEEWSEPNSLPILANNVEGDYCHNFASVKLRPDIIMTLKELSYNFFKAHIFMGIGGLQLLIIFGIHRLDFFWFRENLYY